MEIMNDDGTMARMPQLKQVAQEHGLKIISIRDLIAYRLQQESIVERGVEAELPTEYGSFRIIPFRQKSNGLEKRATDGDYSIAEMQDVLDCKPSIQRLYRTVMEFVPKKKGIVYAINIEHAEHIAEYYMEHGIETVAISANTPLNERRTNIEKFKDGQIQILVNVDLFGEGFDCPDVEFVQLARPTLSLAKYLQMVGRGLRVAKDKECCTILDNVGLYRLFGLPTAE